MSQPASGTLTLGPHRTRLTPTAAQAPSSSPAPAPPAPTPTPDPRRDLYPSRNPSQSVFTNTLIPRDYLASSSSSSSSPASLAARNKPAVDGVPDDHPATGRTTGAIERYDPSGHRGAATAVSPPPDLVRDRSQGQRAPALTGTNAPEPTTAAYPDSPRSFASSSTGVHLPNSMPRTSSIDSAISNISSPSQNPSQPGDGKQPSQEEVLRLIATAGSAENLVLHLLKDKSQAATQNAQLWKLVDKQRALLLGLNKDLERLTKERDRAKKKVKELQHQLSTVPFDRLRRQDGLSPPPDQPIHAAEADSPVDPEHDRAADRLPARSHSAGGRQPSLIDPTMMPSPLHVQQASRLHSLAAQLAPRDSSTTSDRSSRGPQASRKPPPKPLDLRHTKSDAAFGQVIAPAEIVVSDADDLAAGEEPSPAKRGRRKTREEDDRDRELLVLQEQETRSRSKRDTKPKPQASEPTQEADTQPSQPSSHGASQNLLSPGLMASYGSPGSLSLPLRSAGLPTSPRPLGNNTLIGASLPISPRGPAANFPLSPRAPKQPLPMPTTPGQQAPSPEATKKTPGPSRLARMNSNSDAAEAPREQTHETPLSPGDVPVANRRLVSPTWPDFLLPPNALPSVQVKIASSRVRQARNSILGLKPPEDHAVFSLSVFERATSAELWRVEKLPASLGHLDQQLRMRYADLPRLPDRKLFSGQSPAMIDARRTSINAYFEDLLDTPMDEYAAATICQFLSSDVMEPPSRAPTQEPAAPREPDLGAPRGAPPPAVPTKSGYLTKKGKNFGGWKSRYFVLDSPELRYFEAPGGAHLGTIKLTNARIGRQSHTDPASQTEVDMEHQYRHAFLILEPKRKDMNSHLRHVLCAESDAERDEWVETLLHYIDERPADGKGQYGAGVHSAAAKDARSTPRAPVDDGDARATGSPGHARSHHNTPSPSSGSSRTPDLGHDAGPASKPLTISGPMNGSVISDAGLWGNKSAPAAAGGGKDREQQKKRNLFHFRKPSSEQLAPGPGPAAAPKRDEAPVPVQRSGPVRPVFGMQLQEAVEYYSPTNVDVYLPAVVYRCIEFLRAKNAANEEGLFRLSGSNIVIRMLKDRFNSEGDVDLLAQDDEYDVHAVASLFKTYLRELPSTLLTRELHLEFLKVLDVPDKAAKIAAFNGLVHQLPTANFSLLRTLSQYLLEVVQNADRNKMTVKNVGIVFSPTLNIPAPVFSAFLTDFAAIFDASAAAGRSVPTPDADREGALTPEDIRSPRRQMFSDLLTPAYNQSSFAQNAGVARGAPPTPRPAADPAYHAPDELGFTPLQQSYETRNYVSIPHDAAVQPRYPPPGAPAGSGSTRYGGSNNMLAPDHATSVKAKRRESSMLFM